MRISTLKQRSKSTRQFPWIKIMVGVFCLLTVLVIGYVYMVLGAIADNVQEVKQIYESEVRERLEALDYMV